MERACVGAKEAAEMDLLQEQLELSWRVSRRYHTCVGCHGQTEKVGGWKAPACEKPLFYECDKCG